MEEKEQKAKNQIYKKWWFWVIIVVIIVGCIASGNETNTTVTTNDTKQVQQEKDRSMIIYKDDNFLVEITNYKYYSSGRIVFDVYIENNSKKDTDFTIDGDISINGYMVDGGYFYEEVQAGAKANKTFTVREVNIKESELKEMKFKFDIYQGKNYIIEKRIVDDKKITYKF